MKTYFYLLCMAVLLTVVQNVKAQYAKYGITVAGQNNGSSGSDSVHLDTPFGFYVDSSGNVYVADNYNNRIQKWPANGAGKYGTTVAGQKKGTAGSDSAHFNTPTNVFVDDKGNIYVLDQRNSRVQKWAPGSKYGTTVAGQKDGTIGTDSAHFDFPFCVYVDGSSNVYVGDYANYRVQKWAAGAKYGTTVAGQKNGTFGKDSAHLNTPYGIYVDGSGNLYIADANNNRVQKWAPGAKYGTTVAGQKDGTAGKDSAHLSSPYGVYVDGSGNVYVAEYNNHRVQKWAKGATYGTTVAGQKDCTAGSDSVHLTYPFGVYLDGSSNLYVLDAGNNRVQKWARKTTEINTLNIVPTSLNIYPNPSRGQFTINLSTSKSTYKAHIQILNLLGQVVHEQLVDNINGKIHATINTPNLPAGMYLVKVSVGGESAVQRVVISN